MTDTAIAKRPATVVRNYVAPVRDHVSAMQRLQDQYFAALKRAEATYFDGVKRITEGLMRDTEEAIAATPEHANGTTEPAAASA